MKTIPTILAGSILLFSCNNTTEEQEKIKTETVSQEQEHEHNENETIELNNGKKWKVDENMITHIRNMENDVSNFKGTTLTEYKILSENLQKNVDLLTSNCTMKGKAHDELHKWLLPYIDLVKELSEAKDETKAAKQFEYIQTSFLTFNQYFQ
ncbi:MAG: hypothetical protein M3Q56_11345 [Bacteroidota bacterium]|nr:hypothetical protein [Bacteroidota bacterium]